MARKTFGSIRARRSRAWRTSASSAESTAAIDRCSAYRAARGSFIRKDDAPSPDPGFDGGQNPDRPRRLLFASMYKHILLPTDGSALSERAVKEGMRFGKLIGAGLTALHTTPQFYPPQMAGHAVIQNAAREHEERSKESAKHALDAVE